jgi:fatty acid desaturase
MAEVLQEAVRPIEMIREAADAHAPQQRPLPQKWLQCPQRAKEIRALCVPDGRKHLLYGFVPYLGLYAAVAALLLHSRALWLELACAVVLGLLLYPLSVLAHDCMHGTAFRSDKLNRLFGRLYAIPVTMTFTVNRQTHMRHHAYIADPERDPDYYYFSGRLHQIWTRLWRYYDWYTRLALSRYGRAVRNTVLVEQGFNIAVWALIHVLLIRAGLGMKVVYLFWIPLGLLALVLNPITRGYEHASLTLYPLDDPRRRDMSLNTTTVASRWLGLLGANMNYHVEHHAYPRCPFYSLPALHRILQAEKLQYLVAPFPLYRVWKGQAMAETMTCNAAAPAAALPQA